MWFKFFKARTHPPKDPKTIIVSVAWTHFLIWVGGGLGFWAIPTGAQVFGDYMKCWELNPGWSQVSVQGKRPM